MVKIVLYIIAICFCLTKYYFSRRMGLIYLASVFFLQIFKEYLVTVHGCGNVIGIVLWIIPTIIYAIVLFGKAQKDSNDRKK